MSLQDLTTFVDFAVQNTDFQKDISSQNYANAFSVAGLPSPTQAQINALNAIAPDFPALQQLAAAFGVSVDAN
jgi:hypothetical protein